MSNHFHNPIELGNKSTEFGDTVDESSNFPGVTAGIDFDSDTIVTLSQHPNIVGAKFTCGNVGKIHRVAAHTDVSNFAAIGGKSDFLIHGLLAGSTGVSAL